MKPQYVKCTCKHFPVIDDRCRVHGGALRLISALRKQADRKPVAPIVWKVVFL